MTEIIYSGSSAAGANADLPSPNHIGVTMIVRCTDFAVRAGLRRGNGYAHRNFDDNLPSLQNPAVIWDTERVQSLTDVESGCTPGFAQP
jgi:hypothetical protein